ncbi:FMN-binding negative transcriptional regulator [Flavobacterium sp. MAH-1]|uniref:FMN-binding negative transcriptional regulator n=1 Tax=Flavobacterium agri TaxID=2743471 RepID=A0A7Y8Y2M7_9FLAO|nr:FMN-binding negative transcriptional regulator [Flavobacterium agri]NUY81236.1 FMN-binding negative transcriptional regulator [Flavobacterium agri]NYA71260.1 FMN-binding negative transcriptional regulator [Flavobacterium agri]
MYIPKHNRFEDKDEIVAFMKRFGFATIVTVRDQVPLATHLPFIIESRNEDIVLVSHFAKANDQWKEVENDNVLVIFTEPHAYISPSNYDRQREVPTWNYISVHAYGRGKIIEDPQSVIRLLENTIDNFELSYRAQWDNFPDDFKHDMATGIVAFQIHVTDLQAKKKLSQNKTENERTKIIDSLSQSNDANERMIADYMKRDQNQ